jgi:hypothetical protein
MIDTKQKQTLSLSPHGIAISPLHIITYNRSYQPDAQRVRENRSEKHIIAIPSERLSQQAAVTSTL